MHKHVTKSATEVRKCAYISIYTHLQRYDYDKYLLFLVRQDVLDKSPAGADQCQCDEQERPLKSVKKNAIKNVSGGGKQ